MKKIYLLLLFGIIFLLSCSNNSRNSLVNDNKTIDSVKLPYLIDIEKQLKKEKSVLLSSIGKELEYIPLETTPNSMMGDILNIKFTTDYIFLTANPANGLLQFDRKGKFIRIVGSRGRGPGEIDLIVNMSVLSDKKLIIVQTNVGRKLLYFTFDGDFVKTITFTSYVPYVKVLRDGKYLTHDDGGSGKNEYTFCLVNEKMDTISVLKNYNHWVYTQKMMIGIGFPQFVPYYESGGRNYFKTMYNDTVFSVLSDKIIPSYYIDLGKYRLPIELRPERLGPDNMQKFQDKRSDYYFATVFQGSDKLFLTTYCYGKNPQNYFLFKLVSQTGSLLVNKSGTSTGFVNDWDGGIDFWPIGTITDKQVFMPINITSIQKELDRMKSSKKPAKFPDQQKQLIKMISEEDPFNNPILMVVTLKNQN